MGLGMTDFTPAQREVLRKLQTNLPYFLEKCVKIVDKKGQLQPFRLNAAQKYLHERMEAQIERIGRVRIIVLKGRQQGVSTYCSGRQFHGVLFNPNRSAYILSHEASSTAALLDKVRHYYDTLVDPLKPKLTTSNRNTLEMDNGSKYRIGTAGASETGRSLTNQDFHGSEVAFYEQADKIAAGALQTVAEEPGTSVVLESTANGVGGYFYRMVMDTLARPDGMWEVVFIPWFWQEEYRLPVTSGFTPTRDEEELKAAYDLSDEQLNWRRDKITQLTLKKFKQEYPCTVSEAFQGTGEKLLNPEDITRARSPKLRSQLFDEMSAVVMGVDPARTGDRTAIVIRQGRRVTEIEVRNDMNSVLLAAVIRDLYNRHKVDMVFIDMGGGQGAYDILTQDGPQSLRGRIEMVNFGAKAVRQDAQNRRTEMALHIRDWFDYDLTGDVSIPDREDLKVDLLMIPAPELTAAGLQKLPAKDTIRAEYGMSPDIFDALGLTFASKVLSSRAVEAAYEHLDTIRTGPRKSVFSTVEGLKNLYGGPSV
jgi:hypothetical protein